MRHGQIADTGRCRLTVLQVIPALESGGTERGVLEVAEALIAAGAKRDGSGLDFLANLRRHDFNSSCG